MRIAIYHNLASGGGKRALFEVMRRLPREYRVDVYTLSCAEHDFCDIRPHCSQHIVFPFEPAPVARRPFGRLNQGVRSLDLLRLHTLQRRIAAQIDAAGYDVVFVHHCRYGQAPAILQFLGTPSVYYCHEPPRLVYEPHAPRPYARFSTAQRLANCVDPLPWLYRILLKTLDWRSLWAASLVLANSAFSRESLYRTYGVLARVCYLGVDARRFRPSRSTRHDYVISVGALQPLKGFDFLFRVLARLDAGYRLPLVIVSNSVDQRERRYLESVAERLGVRAVFHTLVTDVKLVQLYQRARLTLYAPIMEPFGFVPIESLACGTPVVGVCEGGVRETVVDGVVGRLVHRDPVQFAAAVQGLLDDPELTERYGEQGRSWVLGQWTWEQSVSGITHALESVVDSAAAESSARSKVPVSPRA